MLNVLTQQICTVCSKVCPYHHKIHLLGGFIGLFKGQFHASENSLEFDSVPKTRILLGLCTPSTSLLFKAPRVEFPHHIYKNTQTNYTSKK